MPTDKLIGTIILERVIDSICLLCVFAITFAIQPDLYTDLINAFFHSPHDPTKKKISGFLIAGILIGLVVLVTLMWMLVKKKKIGDVVGIFKKIVRSVWQGVSAVQHLKKRGRFLLYTLALWLCYFYGTYLGFFALQETQQYGTKEAFAILSAGSIGVIITPGRNRRLCLTHQKDHGTIWTGRGNCTCFWLDPLAGPEYSDRYWRSF